MGWREWAIKRLESGAERPAGHDLRATVYELPRAQVQTSLSLLLGSPNSVSGISVTDETVLRLGVAWRCIQIVTGVITTLPLDLMRRVDERTRLPAVGHPFRRVITQIPNSWQTPGEFKAQMQMHLLLRGNAYAYIRRLGGRVRELIPLHPDRVRVRQNDDMSLTYSVYGKNGAYTEFPHSEILHLKGQSTDGYTGLSPLQCMANAVGLAAQIEKTGSNLFRFGTLAPMALEHPGELNEASRKNLARSYDEAGGADSAGRPLILEEGMKLTKIDFSAEDLQFLATRSFQRTDVAMYFGVPGFLFGDVEKSTSWGTGIEQQRQGFLQFTLADWLRIWTEGLWRACLIDDPDQTLYMHFDTKGFLEMDAAARREFYKVALGAGGSPAFMTPNEVRAGEEMSPRTEPWADELPRGSMTKEPANVAT